MPRSKSSVLTVQAWPALIVGKRYPGKVKAVRTQKAHGSHCLHVVLENLDELDQHGRIHELDLPLPLRPGNAASLFFRASGTDASTVGTNIRIDQTVGAVIGMRFRGLGPNDSEEFDFEPIANRPAAAGTDSSAVRLEGEDPRERA